MEYYLGLLYVCAIHIILIYQVEHRRFNEPKTEIPITYGLMARLVLLPRRRLWDAWDRPTAPAPAFLQARCPGSP